MLNIESFVRFYSSKDSFQLKKNYTNSNTIQTKISIDSNNLLMNKF